MFISVYFITHVLNVKENKSCVVIKTTYILLWTDATGEMQPMSITVHNSKQYLQQQNVGQ